MGSTGERVVEDGDVAFNQGQVGNHRLDRQGHRAQVNRHVVAHRDHPLLAVEERAGVVGFGQEGVEEDAPESRAELCVEEILQLERAVTLGLAGRTADGGTIAPRSGFLRQAS